MNSASFNQLGRRSDPPVWRAFPRLVFPSPTCSRGLNVNQKLRNWALALRESERGGMSQSGEGKQERSTASWVTATPMLD